MNVWRSATSNRARWLMVLKTLDVLGPLHGYGIAWRIEQISGDVLAVNQGTLYPVLLKLAQEGVASIDSPRPAGSECALKPASGRRTTAPMERFIAIKAEDLA
jgi:hypothetical protein